MTTIDAHNHLGPRYDSGQTAAELIERLDQAGVDKACVFPFVEGTFSNTVIEDAIDEFPDRLIPFLAVNPWDQDHAASEVREYAKKGFKGVKLHPTIHGYHLSDAGLLGPVLDEIQEAGMIVICHGASDLNNSPIEFARIAAKFPGIPFLMAHSGMFWSHDQAIEVAAEHDNVYLETARVPLGEVAHSIQKLGAGKVIWGTDSPFVDYTFEYQKMARATTSEEDRLLVCGGNVSRLLGLHG
jgi:predicted TIM-barrel fold metal-dependent hydrolase